VKGRGGRVVGFMFMREARVQFTGSDARERSRWGRWWCGGCLGGGKGERREKSRKGGDYMIVPDEGCGHQCVLGVRKCWKEGVAKKDELTTLQVCVTGKKGGRRVERGRRREKNSEYGRRGQEKDGLKSSLGSQ